jgi:uncharacterized membrane protein YcgQ (UPF0703/DUF1980 family)
MTERERLLGGLTSLGFIFIMYLYLKLSGQVPGEGWWIWNGIDYVMVRLFYFALIAVVVGGLLYLIHLYVVSTASRTHGELVADLNKYNESLKWHLSSEKMAFTQQIEALDKKIKVLETEIKGLKEVKEELPAPIIDIQETTLQNFL